MREIKFSPIKKLLFALIKLAKRDMERQFRRAGVGVSQLQYWVLVKLAAGPMTINEIARQFEIKPPSLISVVDALEKARYLFREQDIRDRRKIQLIITAAGLGVVKKSPLNNKTDELNKAFNKLNPVTQGQLLNALRELIANFAKV